MNLNGLVAGIVGTVNPQVNITVQQSNGYTTNPDGTQVPTSISIATTGQVQPLSSQDLRRLDGLNIQGVTAKVYLNQPRAAALGSAVLGSTQLNALDDVEGVVRVLGRGGDLLIIGPYTYLVTAVLERWPDWTCVGVTMQLGA